ncbi:MAG: hypothetical protein ABIH28_03530 [archaeon]
MGIKIESAYGVPGQMSWAYNAIDESNGSTVLEGEVKRDASSKYYLSLKKTDDEKERFLTGFDNPWTADKNLVKILKSRADALLGSKK